MEKSVVGDVSDEDEVFSGIMSSISTNSPNTTLKSPGVSGGCSSTPGSPHLSRLGRVTKLISRSDANLHNTQGRRNRNFSGDSENQDIVKDESTSGTKGSPSKNILSKATGYMSHLKSRITKGRDKSSERQKTTHSLDVDQKQSSHLHQNLSACCGHISSHDSSDALTTQFRPVGSGTEGRSLLKQFSIGTSETHFSSPPPGPSSKNSVEISPFKTCKNSDESSPFKIGHKTRISVDSCESEIQVNIEDKMPINNPSSFYTLNIYLLRGKNLVARDACGSSDPYVKVKIGDKLFHKSKTIYRDLNPIWDESFILPINDITQPIVFKVYDYDWGFQDDFMGMSSLDASSLSPGKSEEMCLTLTENNAPGESPMGEIYLTLTLVPKSHEEKELLNHLIQPKPKSLRSALNEKIDTSIKWLDNQSGGKLADSQKRLKNQIWSSVLTVLLIEVSNLYTTDDDKLLDAFVKFRLGTQKYRSRTAPKSASPKWVEQFDFYLYEGQPQVLEIQLYDESNTKEYIGRSSVDIGLLSKEETHRLSVDLGECGGIMQFLLTVSGTFGTESVSDLMSFRMSDEEEGELRRRYAIHKTFENVGDVGHLTVKVFEAQGLAAADIGGKSDPFVVLELVNSRLQTQTEYRTLNPIWNKIFTFSVRDITDILEVTVFDEDRNHKTEFLGMLQIPLWKIVNGERKWYMLKDRKLVRAAKGNNPQILLELNLVSNPIRAGLRAIDPPEAKFILPDQRLNRETFLLNIDRIRKIGVGIYDELHGVGISSTEHHCLNNLSSFSVHIPTFYDSAFCYDPHAPSLICSISGTPLGEEYPEESESLVLDDEDDENSSTNDGEEKKMSLRQKLQAVQDTTQTLQNALGSIASFCESTRNTFLMVVPFITWLLVLGLFLATIVLYFIPLRYLAMAWGLHRFLRPLLRPNHKPTDEVYNLLLRVPDNQQLILQKPLRAAPVQDTTQRSRSPPTNRTPQMKKKHKFW